MQSTDNTFKMIKEDEDGFVYEIKMDTTAYNFYYVKIVGEKQYIFQTGFTARSSQAEATEMYRAVRH